MIGGVGRQGVIAMELTGVGASGAIGIFGVSASGSAPFAFDQPEPAEAWTKRIALVDEALERSDLGRATHQWREAYGAAVRSGRSEWLIAVGDRAIRVAELEGGAGSFRTEARYVYVHAALRARAERARDTIFTIAERFERLGDAKRAGHMRLIAGSVS